MTKQERIDWLRGERELWVMNDHYLYRLFTAACRQNCTHEQNMDRFIKSFRNTIDGIRRRATE